MQRVYEENEWGKVSKRIVTGIYAEEEGFIFLEGEDYQSTMGGGSLADKSSSEMAIKEVTENFELGLRERIHQNNQ